MADYLISVDWFQVACKCKGCDMPQEGMFLDGTLVPDHDVKAIYELGATKEHHPIFDHALAVLLHGFQLATIFFKPRMSTLPKDFCSVKVSNRLLYSGNWMFYLTDIVRALGWSVNNITRVDLCLDFTQFAGGLAPRTFIDRYLHSGPISDDEPSYYRVGSNKFYTIGRKTVSQQDVQGAFEVCCTNACDYLRFGSRSTGVCVYLYNKSEELATQHNKPYIIDQWVKAGLLKSADLAADGGYDDEPLPIFRLEISVSSGGLNVKRATNAEDKNAIREAIAMEARHIKPISVSALSLNDFMSQSQVEALFWAYAAKYFRFKVVGTQKYKHNWPDLHLFDVKFEPTIKPYSISRVLDAGVSERNAANTCKKLLATVAELSLPEMISLDNAADVLERYAHVKATTADVGEVCEVVAKLREGYNFDEVKRMAIASAVHLEQYKNLIYSSIYHDLREILTDSDVSRAVDLMEFERALAEERDTIRAQWEQTTI